MGTNLKSLKSNLQKTGDRPKTHQKMAISKIAKSRVPEGLAKKRSRFAKQAAAKAEAKAVAKKNSLAKRREIITKARKYAAEYAAEAKALVNNTKAARDHGNYFVPDEPKLALVIRIRGINQLSPKPKKTLQLLRLRQIGNAVFVRLNAASLQMLRICDPFIAWGYPTQKTIKNMIYKRGAVKINGQRIKITNNDIGENFKTVNNNLYPVKLSCPRGGWRKITNHFIEGGDFGNREQYINDLVKKMN